MGRQSKAVLAGKILLLVAFVAAIVALSITFAPRITRLMSKPDQSREFLLSFGSASALIYIGIQAVQVIIAVIPGEFVQLAGGYVFGTVLGTLYSVIGIFLGTFVVFFATRILGFSLVRMFVSQKNMEKFDFLINNPKSDVALFVLFLIPGIPKDTLVYIAGLTPIKPLKFLLIATMGRFPGLLGSSYIGANLQERDYLAVWIVSIISTVCFIAGLLAKDKIIGLIHRLRSPRKDSPKE